MKKFNGKESLFLKRDSTKSNNQANFSEDLEGSHNNSFLDFLDTIKTLGKGSKERNISSHEYSKLQSPKTPVKDSNETSVRSHEHFMAQSTINIIEQLVTTNSNIQQLLSDERKVNNDLKNKITKLQVEVEKLKYENCRLLDSSLVIDVEKTDKIQERTSIATVDSNPGEKIAQQWKEIQKQKHRQFTQLKAQKEQAQETSDVRRKTIK